MSASREKKQRQSAGPDQKALKAQQEQAARKQKTIVYSIVGAAAAVLVIALLVWRTGFFQARAAAATVGGETLSTAQLSYYYHTVRSSFLSSGYASVLGYDSTVSDDKQTYNPTDGQTYRDYFMENALQNAQTAFALEPEAIAAGHTEAEVKDDLDSYISSVKSAASSNGVSYRAYLRLLYGPYMSAGVFERELTRSLMAELVSSEKQADLFDSYTQADLEAYYQENADSLDTIEYSYLYFANPTVDTKDKDGNELGEDEVQKLTDEAKAETKEKAEEALEAVKGGAHFHDQAEKYELNVFGDHTTTVGVNSLSSSYQEQLLKLGKDECELVETDNGCYVISFHDRYLLEEPTRDVRHIAVLAETTTDESGNAVAPTDEAWAAAKEKMDAIEAEWNAGEKTEEAFAALAEKYNTEQVGSDLLERIASNNTSLIPELLDWIFADHQVGDTGVIQHSAADSDGNKFWSYHLVFYVGENEPVWMGSVRTTLANEDTTEWTDGIFADYPTATQGGANYLGK